MGLTNEQLSQILGGKAKALCTPEGDKYMDNIKNKQPGGFNDPDPASFNDAAFFDSMYLNEDTSYNNNYNQNSNMPDAIKQSFAENQIDYSRLSNVSVLDKLPVSKQKRTVNENRQQPQQQPQVYNNGGQGVDYSIIKAIINECLKEYFSTQQLNESANLKTIALKKGKIKLVDNKGNVYEAKLELKGNINENKE